MIKPTKNRKTVSYRPTIKHNGTTYKINAGPSRGVYLQLIHKAIEQLDVCIVLWRRVFVIRFDLHQRAKAENSEMISRFRKNLLRRLERKYHISELGYVWARELRKVESQHYHFVVFLDGDKLRHSKEVSKIIMDTWLQVKEGNFAYMPKHCFYNVVDSETKNEAIERISYLAKVRDKGYRPPQAKDYGTSRLYTVRRPAA